MDHLMRLGGGEADAIALLIDANRQMLIGAHQDIGDTRRFKQHAAVGHNNQKGFQGVK